MTRHIFACTFAVVLGCVSEPSLPGQLAWAMPSPTGSVTIHPVSASPVVPARSVNASPSITRVAVGDLSTSTTPQDLTVEGARFLPALQAMLTDPAGNVRALGSTAIAQVESATFQFSIVLELAGEYSLVVVNPDGHLSNAYSFSVGASPTLAEAAGPRVTNWR